MHFTELITWNYIHMHIALILCYLFFIVHNSRWLSLPPVYATNWHGHLPSNWRLLKNFRAHVCKITFIKLKSHLQSFRISPYHLLVEFTCVSAQNDHSAVQKSLFFICPPQKRPARWKGGLRFVFLDGTFVS